MNFITILKKKKILKISLILLLAMVAPITILKKKIEN